MKILIIISLWDILIRLDIRIRFSDRSFGIGLRNPSDENINYMIAYTHGRDSDPHKVGLFEYNLDPNELRLFFFLLLPSSQKQTKTQRRAYSGEWTPKPHGSFN